MIRPGAVQQKIPCLFLTDVRNEPSNKRENQTFKVLATETINPKAQETDVYNAVPTEKIDGTCCYVALYKGFKIQYYGGFRGCRKQNTANIKEQNPKSVLGFRRLPDILAQNKLSWWLPNSPAGTKEIGPFIISYERRVTYKKTRVQIVFSYKQQDANVSIWKLRPRYYFVPAVFLSASEGTIELYLEALLGKPYLWARLDRKPNKQAEKRFKRLIHAKGDSKDFIWNVEEDFKPVPESWIPAKEMQQSDGKPLPDDAGHIPGWVPVEKDNKQYCWHSSVINYEAGVALVLRPHSEELDILEICIIPLSHLLEQTLELIGTNINSNPYELGSKKHPIHFLVSHGTFHIQNLPTLSRSDLLLWFETCEEAKVEGVVWHCKNGALVKLHRHHLGLSWPIPDARLNSQTTVVNVVLTKYECDFPSKSLFTFLSCMSGQRFERLKDIVLDGL